MFVRHPDETGRRRKTITKFLLIINLFLTRLVYDLQVTSGKPGVNMVCQFCYDRPIVKATGHSGKMVEVSCPVCGMKFIHNPESDVDNVPPRRKSGDPASDKKQRARP
jgi:hypothetical protein